MCCCSKTATPEKTKSGVRNFHTCQPSCFDQPFSGSEWHPNAEVVLSFLIGMCLGGDAVAPGWTIRNYRLRRVWLEVSENHSTKGWRLYFQAGGSSSSPTPPTPPHSTPTQPIPAPTRRNWCRRRASPSLWRIATPSTAGATTRRRAKRKRRNTIGRLGAR